MPKSPSPHPHRDRLQLSQVLYALADPSRLCMVRELVRMGEMPSQSFPVTAERGTIAHHLKVLREAGLTWTRVEGRRRLVSLRRSDMDRRFPGLLEAVLGDLESLVSPHTGMNP